MIQTKKKAVFGIALMLGCFVVYSFTSTENEVSVPNGFNVSDGAIIGGGGDPDDCKPLGDTYICERDGSGGIYYRGRRPSDINYLYN